MGAMSGEAVRSLEKLHSSEAWSSIRDAFFATGDAAAMQSSLTALIDQMAVEAFSSTLGAAFPQRIAMLAVGGFGRRELFPYSDIDITILLENETQSATIKEPLSEFVRLLWDAGLRLSHSVRTINECVEVHEQNIELNISLLDRRFLAGDREVFNKLEGKFPLFLTKQGPKLAKHLCQLTRARHTKYQDTLFHLEPDVKETPGGLRDLHFIGWLARLRPEQRTDAALGQAAAFLSSLRCFLHYTGGRDRNVLNFEAQDQIAEQPFTSVKTPELWMREYFNHARVIFREAQRTLDACERSENSLFSTFRDMRSRVSNSEFTVSRERVFLKNPAALESDPGVILRLAEFIARHGVPAAVETERRLEGARERFSAWCASTPLWPKLKVILALPYAPAALRLLQNTGLLEIVFPEWKSVVSLVVRDFYHRYTVDEHTLVTIERLTELRRTQDGALKRFADLLAELDNPAILIFALLYHDVGKGAHTGNHSEVSLEWARNAMIRMETPAEERAAVEFLVAHHLALSEIMTARDLGDPATARAIAERVGTIERLKLLTVMTYADISGVNPGAMTPWRLEQLWRVYRIAQQELTRELETERIREVPKDLMPGRAEFIKGFPVRYLRTHAAALIESHLKLYELSRPTGVAVQLERAEGAYRMTVVARDMPFLFASLAGALSSFGLDILKAEAFANSKGCVLDTFVFADPKRTLDLNPSEGDRLQDLIRKVATGKTDVQKLLKNRPQPDGKRKPAEPAVQFDSEACDTATLVEINTEDRPGLLYSLASVFSSTACNIDVVLIDTKGHRAIDVFYVAHEGQKLSPELQTTLKERLLAAC